MLPAARSPGGRCEVRQFLNSNICQPGQNRGEILADWDVETTAAFSDRQYGGHPRPSGRTADMDPVLAAIEIFR